MNIVNQHYLPAVMLDEGFTILDAINQGIECSNGKDGDAVTIFDQSYAFVVLEVKNGVAKEQLTNPVFPPNDPTPPIRPRLLPRLHSPTPVTPPDHEP